MRHTIAYLRPVVIRLSLAIVARLCARRQHIVSAAVEADTLVCLLVTVVHRYPVPDKYSITLEISRDRTTAVKEAPCGPTISTSALCTSDLLDTEPGTRPVYRAVNEPCTKLVCPQSAHY